MTPDFIEHSAFYVKDVALPFVTLFLAILAPIIAIKRGFFRVTSRDNPERPINIHVEGHVGALSTGALEKFAIDEVKVDEYHQQSIHQSKISFWFSLVLATLGFLVIATSVFTYSEKSGYVGVIAGTITESVAALFFYQTNRARSLMADFFDRLRADRKLVEALKLCEATTAPAIQDALRVRLALHFAGIDKSDEALRDILDLRKELPDPNEKQDKPTGSGR